MEGQTFNDASFSEAQLIDVLVEGLDYYSTPRVGTDIYMQEFYRELDRLISRDEDVRRHFEDVLEHRATVSHPTMIRPLYLANLAFRLANRNRMFDDRDTKLRYPDDYTASVWRDQLPRIIDHEAYMADFFWRAVQSNRAERYIGPKMFLNINGGQSGRRTRILDIGCSRNHGLKYLDRNLSLGPPVVDVEHTALSEKLEQFMAILPSLARTDIGVFGSFGTDVWSERLDPDQPHWVEACSLKPSELRNKRNVKFYRDLDRNPSPNTDFVQSDFSEEDLELFEDNALQVCFNAVTFMTVLYQVPPDRRLVMLRNAKNYVRQDGVIIVQDFCEVDPDDPHRLHFPEKQFEEPYGYRMFVFDMRQPDLGFQEVWRFENGRCQKIAINLGAKCLQSALA